jgi:hypothetical protein
MEVLTEQPEVFGSADLLTQHANIGTGTEYQITIGSNTNLQNDISAPSITRLLQFLSNRQAQTDDMSVADLQYNCLT